jgi:hypothetical protein
MIFPQHEAILGAYVATAKVDPGAQKSFKNRADAMEAYRKGQITMSTPITIKDK